MFSDYDLAYQLMKDLAETIDGYFYAHKFEELLIVTKEDYLIRVEFEEHKSRQFEVLTPIHFLPKESTIHINKKFILGKVYYKNEQYKMFVTKDEVAKKLADALLADFEFQNRLKELFVPNYYIEINENGIKLHILRSVESSFTIDETLNKNHLIQMIELVKEIKTAMKYYIKRNYPQ